MVPFFGSPTIRVTTARNGLRGHWLSAQATAVSDLPRLAEWLAGGKQVDGRWDSEPDAGSGPLAVGAAGLAHGGTDDGHLGRALLGKREGLFGAAKSKLSGADFNLLSFHLALRAQVIH